jgi:hypothetical protein
MVAKDIEAGEQRKTQSERLTVIIAMCIISGEVFEAIEPTPSTERRPIHLLLPFDARVALYARGLPMPCLSTFSPARSSLAVLIVLDLANVSSMLTCPIDNDTLFFQMTRCGHPRCARCDSELSDGQWRGGEVRFLSSFGRTSVRSSGPELSGRYGGENEDNAPRCDPHSFAPCPVRALAVPALGFSSGSEEETLAGGRVILLQVEGDSEQE